MLVCYLPRSTLFDEDQCRTVFLVDSLAAGIEAVVENEGRNANVAENVDPQGICPHRQILSCPQSIVLAFSPGSGIQPL